MSAEETAVAMDIDTSGGDPAAASTVDVVESVRSTRSGRSSTSAADRVSRAAGRATARQAMAASVSALKSATGVDITERELLRAQADRERQIELSDLMEETENAANDEPTRRKNNNDTADSDGAAAAASSSSRPSASPSSKSAGLLDDVEVSESDLQLLDDDTRSRTKHNKRMRAAIKDGAVKQERFVRAHIKEFRAFLNKKTRRKYEEGKEDGEEDDREGEQEHTNEEAQADAPADAPAIPLPQSKVFTKQPSYILNGQMREYQLQGLNWMITRHDNCTGGILGDEMGLGKTLQVISFLSYLRYERGITGPHLIVVPLSVMSAWMTEFRRWSPGFRVVRYHGPLAERRRLQNDDAAFGNFDVILTTYEMILGDEDFFRYRVIWNYVIIDEAQRIKNEKTLQAQALASIQRFNCILLSGTPTQNNTHEIWALLHFLLPRVFTSSEPFDRCFNLITNSVDQSQLLKLHTLLRPLMLRRVKAEIQQKLPKKTETKIFVGLSELQREWYKKLVSKDMGLLIGQSDKDANASAAAASSSNGDAAASASPSTSAQGNEWRRLMSLMMQLRKVTNHPYLISADAEPNWEQIRRQEAEEDAQRTKAGEPTSPRESIETRAGRTLIQSSGKMVVLDKLLTKLKAEGSHRVLIFSLFTRVLDLLEDVCASKGWKFLRLDGSTNRVRRSVDIGRFNAPNSKFFIYLISTRAGGLGINLTGADTVIHYDSDFNPQVDLQAQDRCHRIGQTKPVNVYRFITENTVEERLIARAEKKLYLDVMVNRVSHNADGDAALAGSDQDEMTKLSKDEMLSMLMFGAGRIFKATGAEHREEEIDAILTRSIAKEEEAKAGKLKSLMEKRTAIAAAAATGEVKVDVLLEDDGQQVIAQEMQELKEVAGDDNGNETSIAADADEVEEKGESAPAAAAAASASVSPSPSPSPNILENTQMSVKDFLFDVAEKNVREFEGRDYTRVRRSRKDLLADLSADFIVEAGSKRERKQRLITVASGRGQTFAILAENHAEEPLRDQRLSVRKRGRPRKERPEPEPEPVKVEAEVTTTRRGRPPKNVVSASPPPVASSPSPSEPEVIGYDYAIDWSKSSSRTVADLERAVTSLNQLDASGVDVTAAAHKLSLWIRRSDRWNMSAEDRAAYHRRVAEEHKQMVALRDAKRRRWAEGAPEEAWLTDEKLEKQAEQSKQSQQVTATTGKRKSKGQTGYVYTTKYIHEDWCHLCKMGGDLLCCGYCPRTFHKECIGLSRAPSGYFSCPQHKCAKCERGSQEAGGMLFRCVVCPCSYCEDDVPTEYDGRQDLDRCFELESTGYAQPSSAFYITCSHSCTKYYQDYLAGKFTDASESEVAEPIPVDLVEAAHANAEAEAQRAKEKADAAAAAAAADAAPKGRRGRKTRGGNATAAAATPSPSPPPVEEQKAEETFSYVPPTESAPHVCACLVPKKVKPKLYCICRTPYDKRRAYLACDGCSQWYHLTCVGMKENADVETIEWTCKACELKEKQKASKSGGVFELASDADESSSDSDSEEEVEDDDIVADEPEENDGGGKRKKRKGATKKSRNDQTRNPKKQKVRHPVEGGPLPAAPTDATTDGQGNFAALPTLEQCFAMNFGVGGAGMVGMGGMAGMPFMNMTGMDPVAFAQMMSFFGTSGGVVAADGRVQQADVNPFSVMPVPVDAVPTAAAAAPPSALPPQAAQPQPTIAQAVVDTQNVPMSAVTITNAPNTVTTPVAPAPPVTTNGLSLAAVMAAAANATTQQ